MTNYMRCDLPLAGRVLIAATADDSAICRVAFEDEAAAFAAQNTETSTPLLRCAAKELEEYLTGNRREFTVPLSPPFGSDFARLVWRIMTTQVPYGTTVSYGELAKLCGRSRSAARAIGMACNRNPLPLFVPCHRIVGGGGALTGYRGGLVLKAQLLALESARL